jgi:hypothetical protein
VGRTVGPESLEVLAQKIGARRLEVVLQKLPELHRLLGRQIRSPLQERPPRILQYRLVTILFQAAGLPGPYLIHGLAEVSHNVEAVQDVNRFARPTANDAQVRSPHIAANVLESPEDLLSQHVKEPLERVLRPGGGDPQEATTTLIDLVHQRQVPVASLVLDLIDSNGDDTAHLPMYQAPGNRMANSPIDRIPTATKNRGHLAPGQASCPPGQEPAILVGLTSFSFTPGNFLRHDAAGRAVDSAQCVHEHDGDLPHGDKLPGSFRQAVISWTTLAALAADRPTVLARLHLNQQRGAGGAVAPSDVSEHERLVIGDAVEDSL